MNTKKIIEEDPLFSRYEIDLDLVKSLMKFNQSIDRYCPQCNNDSVFRTHKSKRISSRGSAFEEEKLRRPKIIKIEFRCSRNSNHLSFVAFIQTEDEIIKAGQYPSTADILKPEIKKFRKDFPLDYEELRRAYGLADHDVGIGAFTYLRRIFERRLKFAAQRKEEEETSWNKKEIKDLRVKEKIDELAEQLPQFLVDNKSVYSILSTGIHNLNEKRCLKHFNILSKSIELLLEQELEIVQKNRIEDELSKEINEINQDVGN